MSTYAEMRRILLIVLALNLAVSIAKMIVGFLTRSISMQADGLHSLVDATSNVVGLGGIWLASRPPDENHPYGHRKFETLASSAIGALLLFTTIEILQGAVDRLLHGGAPEPDALAFGVLLTTMVINIIVATWEQREGARLGSHVLEADATQTRSDIFVSLAVIVSLVAARLGFPQLDAVVALAVAALVAHSAWQVLRHASTVLSDAEALPRDELVEVVSSVPGVMEVHRAWTRGHEREIFVDLDIRVNAALTVEQGHELAHAVRGRVRERWPEIRHIMVHVEPTVPPRTTAQERVHHLARQRNLHAHDVRVHETEHGRQVLLHLEVDPRLNVGEAHRIADELERTIAAELPQVTDVTTHIESANTQVRRRADITRDAGAVAATVRRIADETVGAGRCHEVRIYERDAVDGTVYDLIIHLTLPRGLPLSEAHDLSEAMEHALREQMERLGTITIHTEPPEES